jgi:tetratricopeptide (TPR) repeat protein
MRIVMRLLYVLLSLSVLFASTAAAQTDTASDTEARTLFAQGREAYDAGNFEEATRAFRRAYLLSPRYALLYNIGQSELRAGHDSRALEAFEAFLRQAPADDARRSEVEERTRVLRSMGVTPEPSTTTTTTTPPDEPSETEPDTGTSTPVVKHTGTATPSSGDGGPGVAPWILVGGGAAAMIAGAVLMGVGAANASQVTDAPDGSQWSELEGTADGAQTMWGVGIVLAGVGLAAAGVGLVWALTGSSGGGDEATARLRIGPTSIALEGNL